MDAQPGSSRTNSKTSSAHNSPASVYSDVAEITFDPWRPPNAAEHGSTRQSKRPNPGEFQRSRKSLAIHLPPSTIPEEEETMVPKYQSYFYAPPEDPDASVEMPRSEVEPHWDDLVFFKRQPPSKTMSIITDSDADELSLLLGPSGRTGGWGWVKWTGRMWKRNLVLVVLPVFIVMCWCSVPFPYEVPVGKVKPAPGQPEPLILNFWFFLFFYYGSYNLMAIVFMNKMFAIYSLDWWPSVLNGTFWTGLLLMCSMAGGLVLRFLLPQYCEYTLAWILLTFLTMTVPLLSALWKIRADNRNILRHSLTIAQRMFSATEQEEHRYRIPASYRRFLWFVLAIFIALSSLVGGGWYAYNFVSTPERSGIAALVYVYSWVCVIYLLDFICETIIDERVKCHPLSGVLRLYFYTVYFVFYRNLFARLRNIQQFIMIQTASSLWVMTFYPLRISKPVHSLMVSYFGASPNYEVYQRCVGQIFFMRNVAENATMLGFLCWMNVLNKGPNRLVYPYFQFNTPNNPYNYQLTMWASLVIWAFELVSNYCTRMLFKKVHGHSITREAVRNFQKFPECVSAMVVVSIWVMMGILLALLALHF